MKDTLRETAPSAGTYSATHPTASTVGTTTAGTTGGTTAVGVGGSGVTAPAIDGVSNSGYASGLPTTTGATTTTAATGAQHHSHHHHHGHGHHHEAAQQPLHEHETDAHGNIHRGNSSLEDPNARLVLGDGASHSTSIGGHGTSNPAATQSVVEKLQANIQASVREATGGRLTDPDVAKDLGSKSSGKNFLEGVGLGGDERLVNLRDVKDDMAT